MITLQVAWFIILSAFLVEMSRLAFRSTQDPPLENALVLSLMLLALYPFDWFPLLFPAIGALWGVVLLVLFGIGRVRPNRLLSDIGSKHRPIYYGYLACVVGMTVYSGVSCAGLWTIS